MPAALRLLVLDAYDRAGRAALRGAGGTEAGTLYARMLRALEPAAAIDVAHPADADEALPAALRDYDGVAWTGSNLSLCSEGPAVRRQVELARAAFEAGVPSFGSCYAAQLAVVAAGGACRAHPRGREFGVSRDIALSAPGRAHPLFAGKAPVFDAWTSHADEVATLPAGAQILAANPWSRVQAVAVRSGRGAFWALQYHPEYDPHEVASLCALRADELVAQGTFRDADEAAGFREALEALHREPARGELARRLGVAPDLLRAQERRREVRNWLEHLVKPGVRR